MFFFCNQRRSTGRNDGFPQEDGIRVNRVRRLIRHPIKRSPTRKAKPTIPIPHGLSVLVLSSSCKRARKMKNASPPLIKANWCRSSHPFNFKRFKNLAKPNTRNPPKNITPSVDRRLGNPQKTIKKPIVPRRPVAKKDAGPREFADPCLPSSEGTFQAKKMKKITSVTAEKYCGR